MKVFSKIVYHGTPNDFDNFDTEHMSTGEGQQVHGWGLYFAEDKSTVKLFYSDLNSISDTYPVIELDGEKYQLKLSTLGDIRNYFYTHGLKRDYPLGLISNMVMGNKQLHKLSSTENVVYDIIDFWIKDKEDWLKQVGDDNRLKQRVEEDLDDLFYLKKFLHEHRFSFNMHKNESYLFEIELPDNLNFIEETAIFYDPEYNQNYKTILESIAKQNGDADLFGGKMKYSTFYSVYEYLSQLMDGAKNVSLALEKYGINGIHYNGERDGSCYVVFDPKNINIISKEKI